MADLPPNAAPINDEEVAAEAPVSEALLSKVGGNINALLASVMPVGAEIGAYLTELQFQQEVGSTDWVLLDGRSCVGTRFHAITGMENLPDHRGAYGRGKNNGRNDGKQDPAGELELGSWHGDDFRAHNHGGGVHNHRIPLGHGDGGARDKAADGDKGQQGPNVNTYNSGAIIQTEGGAETKVKCIIKNYFIRIN